MFTTYEETVAWIHSLFPHGIKPGLKRVEWMLDELGHPERRLRSLHIGGTNGKGSTVSFLRHMMQEGGYRVGTFTSPYIVRFNERISVDGQGIGDTDLVRVANRVKPLVDRLRGSEWGTPTEFEVITVIAMVYFAEISIPDFVLFEVGLGGRLDSTNVIHPILSVITNVGHDHQAILGHEIKKIAAEKAGIIKPGTPVVTAAKDPEALAVIRETSRQKNAKLYVLDEAFSYIRERSDERGERFSYRCPFKQRNDLSISMKGRHQVQNAVLALMAVDYLKQYFALMLEEDELRNGLEKAYWPGRFEEISQKPRIVLDGAHNPEGMQTLADTLEHYYPGKHIVVLFAALKNKNIGGMLPPIRRMASKVILTSFAFEGAAAAEDLAEQAGCSAHVEEDWRKVLEETGENADEDTVIIVTGSLYFISQVRNYLK